MTAIVTSIVFMPAVCAARPPYTIPPRDKHLKGKITKKRLMEISKENISLMKKQMF